MTAPESHYRTVPSVEIATAVDPYVGSPQYDTLVGDNQNKLILPEMTVQMTPLEEPLKV